MDIQGFCRECRKWFDGHPKPGKWLMDCPKCGSQNIRLETDEGIDDSHGQARTYREPLKEEKMDEEICKTLKISEDFDKIRWFKEKVFKQDKK